jgi:hypothetical protein
MSMSLLATMRVVSAVALCIALVGAVQAQVSAQLAQKSPEAAEIAAKATQNGNVRVIVQIAAPGVPTELRPEAGFLAPVKTQIASLQDTIIASHFGSATSPREGQGFPRNLVRFEIRPLIAVNVSPNELDELAADSRIVFIQYDRPMPPTLLQSVPLIGMPAAYQAGATGLRQAVAILDTGVQGNHQFLSGNLLLEACFSGASGVSLCPNGQMTQFGPGASEETTAQCISGGTNICDHGSHVAGIAAGNNTVPGGGNPDNGVAKGAKIVSIQVFSRFNDNGDCNNKPPCVLANNSNQMQALDWVYQNALTPAGGVYLAAVNMSIGGGRFTLPCDTDLRKASIDNLRRVGVPTVISAGNDGYTNAISSPACISTAVAVASNNKIAPMSNTISSFTNVSSQVALIAPGGFGFLPDDTAPPCAPGGANLNVLSSSAATSSTITNTFDCFFGTSMAAPHVAGAFAAVRTVCPNATIDRIVVALQSTGVLITDTRPAIQNVQPAGSQTKPRIQVDLALNSMGCARHDFNADGKSDILWRDASGNTALWLMNGAQVSSSAGLGAPPLVYSIVGQRDFNGDGKSDILWRDNAGNTSIWFMNGTTVAWTAALPGVSTAFSVVGLGDFNGDGAGGILWEDMSGNLMIWIMNGAQVTLSGSYVNQPMVAGAGDFNGDGKTDILWRHTGGDIGISFVDGTTIASEVPVGNVPTTWSVVGTGDFNGDGKSDIVWRDSSGNTSIWLMNGASVLTDAGLGNVPTIYSIVQIGDYNGDGLSDILWRDTSGNTSIWFMNGTTVSSTGSIGNIPTNWTVQSVNAQ